MTLGDTKDFFVLSKVGTDQFYRGPDSLTPTPELTADVLGANLCSSRADADDYYKRVMQIGIAAEQRTPRLEIVHVRITTERL